MLFCHGGIILVLKETPASSYFLVYLARQYSRSRVRRICLSPLLNFGQNPQIWVNIIWYKLHLLRPSLSRGKLFMRTCQDCRLPTCQGLGASGNIAQALKAHFPIL
jgi:hypothetical protein